MTEKEYIRELEAQVADLKEKLKVMTKERNFYRRDLEKERESQNDAFLAGLEAAMTPIGQRPVKPGVIVDADPHTSLPATLDRK